MVLVPARSFNDSVRVAQLFQSSVAGSVVCLIWRPSCGTLTLPITWDTKWSLKAKSLVELQPMGLGPPCRRAHRLIDG